jgi:hypothetical protein
MHTVSDVIAKREGGMEPNKTTQKRRVQLPI